MHLTYLSCSHAATGLLDINALSARDTCAAAGCQLVALAAALLWVVSI
jgi:hypothetical protein